MKIYFDESGQSGCVLTKKELLNFQKQPTFALGALVIPTDTQERALCKKYLRFLEKFEIKEEIKGSDLLIRKMNAQLSYFLDNFFNDKYFFVILYDKRFYLATLLLLGLIGREYQQTMPLHFYEQATFLSYQSDDFFVKYLQYIESPSPETYKQYLTYLIEYDYQMFNVKENAVVEASKKIIEDEPELFYDDFMTFGWYDNPEQTNVISFYDLGEQLLIGECLNEAVSADKIREYIWFMETKAPYTPADGGNTYYLGKHNDAGYYFYYEPQRVTVLDYAFLATITEKASSTIIYADRCSISEEKLSQMGIVFKKIPRDISRL